MPKIPFYRAQEEDQTGRSNRRPEASVKAHPLMSDMCRCFIALELSSSLKNRLAELRAIIDAPASQVRWIKPDNLHITLKFLGDQPPKTIAQIIGILQALDLPKQKITIRLLQLGAFPNNKNPRILWAGFEDNPAVIELYKGIESALSSIGIPKEKRPFVGHITIARVKTALDEQTRRSLEKNTRLEPILEPVKQLTFYKSILSSGGSSYEPLTTIDL